MRIHLQSHAGPENFPLTPEIWAAAAARAPDISGGHAVSFGYAPEDFAGVADDVELLVVQKAALTKLLPLKAPSLKMIYATSAGIGEFGAVRLVAAGGGAVEQPGDA